MSASLSIKLDVIAGTHAKHAASALSRIAAQLWVIAEADFNGTRMRAHPGESAYDVERRWNDDHADSTASQTEARRP